MVASKKYVLLLDEKNEFMFYTFNKTYDPFARVGEVSRSFNNLHGDVNPFSLFIEIEKFIRYLFSRGVMYFYFSCEGERFDIYQFFISRLVKKAGYYSTNHKQGNEFYVYKCL
ncbi:hypothetical protein HC723_15230 [Vibrio sp. S11_S32]|uniref:hypothetical protein n=1 Tax=Vibrio sp. S11_S32 TaxID=2720225 RepID=UPI00168026C5|nr:hypothetical protein [Vibrio sp. S11_S32]MBD1577756.1 hypothetical protein [Vibrio sp. S11_S32]